MSPSQNSQPLSLLPLSYSQGHIWACPPSEGDDYIFHCHPADQKIPKPKRLQEWYKKMLDTAFVERIIHDVKVGLSMAKAFQAYLVDLVQLSPQP